MGRYEGTALFLGRRAYPPCGSAIVSKVAMEPQYVCGAATSVGTRRRKSRHPLAGSCQGINHPYSPLFSFFRSVWLLVVPPVRLTPSAPRFACMWYRFFPAPVPLQDQGLGTCSPRRRPSRPLAHRAPANRRDPTVSMEPPGQGGGLVEPPAKPEVLRRRGGAPPLITIASSQCRGLSSGEANFMRAHGRGGGITRLMSNDPSLVRRGAWRLRTQGSKPT